jgi:hypothetical protein
MLITPIKPRFFPHGHFSKAQVTSKLDLRFYTRPFRDKTITETSAAKSREKARRSHNSKALAGFLVDG